MMICIETSAVIFTLSGIICTVCACIFPYWKVEKSSSYLKNLSPSFNIGLWSRCHKSVGTTSAGTTCRSLDDLYADLPTEIQAMRILILVALACQTAAFIFSIFGLKCTSIGLQRPDLKYRLNIVSLVFHINSLISITIGTVMFTNALITNSESAKAGNQVSELWYPLFGNGEESAALCLYLASGVMALCLVNIVLVTFITVQASKPNQRYFAQLTQPAMAVTTIPSGAGRLRNYGHCNDNQYDETIASNYGTKFRSGNSGIPMTEIDIDNYKPIQQYI